MLLIDGVKYELWTPSTEDEFEWVVKAHTEDIFGEESIYFDLKKKLTTKAGIGSIPDGYVISFREPPCWYICEVELRTHPLYEHIVPQITKFINGVKSFETQREIINALDGEISGDPFKEALVINKTGSREVYRFISKLISKPPVLAILIDQRTKELEEVCDSLPIEVRIVEFKTFIREGTSLAVHAHLFEPLYKGKKKEEVIPPPLGELEITIRNPSNMKFHTLDVPRDSRRFFPGYKIPFELETDVGTIQTWVSSAPEGTEVGDPDKGTYIQRNLAEWYRRHPTIQVGDKVVFEVIEAMKRYRLEVSK